MRMFSINRGLMYIVVRASTTSLDSLIGDNGAKIAARAKPRSEIMVNRDPRGIGDP